jgi:hypothetical protein
LVVARAARSSRAPRPSKGELGLQPRIFGLTTAHRFDVLRDNSKGEFGFERGSLVAFCPAKTFSAGLRRANFVD